MDLYNQIQEAAKYIQEKSKHTPEIGLILGSGLGAIGDKIENAEYYPYSEIPHFPVSTVEGHAGRLRSEEHTSELQSRQYLVCRLLLEKKKTYTRLVSVN